MHFSRPPRQYPLAKFKQDMPGQHSSSHGSHFMPCHKHCGNCKLMKINILTRKPNKAVSFTLFDLNMVLSLSNGSENYPHYSKLFAHFYEKIPRAMSLVSCSQLGDSPVIKCFPLTFCHDVMSGVQFPQLTTNIVKTRHNRI